VEKEIFLDTSASGHHWIYTESRMKASRIGRLLSFRYGFWRWGLYVPPITDEAIYPSYVRWHLKIYSGWDNWVGFDFLSANEYTDEFLEQFSARHLTEINDIRPDT